MKRDVEVMWSQLRLALCVKDTPRKLGEMSVESGMRTFPMM